MSNLVKEREMLLDGFAILCFPKLLIKRILRAKVPDTYYGGRALRQDLEG
jgi:hypothetical protein